MFYWNCYLQHEKSIQSALKFEIAIFNRRTNTGTQQVKFSKIKSCLAHLSGIFALGTPSNSCSYPDVKRAD